MANRGRPTKYNPEYCQDIIEYFKSEANETLPLFEEYATNLDISKSTLYKWAEDHKDFSDAMQKAKQIQETKWIQKSLANEVNVKFSIFMGKNCFGWTDRTESTHKVDSVDDIIKAISGD
jgi:sugar-specific transcriptional regulator TrmB